ncbi:MAG TPA: hypothetical protein VF739_04590 [Ktedonobacterales bacterium]
MATPTDLDERAERFLAILSAQAFALNEAYEAGRELIAAAKGASAARLDALVTQFAPLISQTEIVRAGILALASGALAEAGANIEPSARPILARYAEALQEAIPFIEACNVEIANGALGSREDVSKMSHEERVARVTQLAGGPMPKGLHAVIALKPLNSATMAVLSRSKALRIETRADPSFAQADARLNLLGFEQLCLREMLAVLDDEEIVVLHPGLARGYFIRVAGIGKNFQLYTLVEGALIGDEAEGWLPGRRPSPETLALAKDAPMNLANLPSAAGYFNLWNWTGLRSDATLEEGLQSDSAHWIWIEGLPADIVAYHGTRVILLGQAPYARGWNAGRYFPAMAGELEVVRQMPEAETRRWLDELARAPKPTLAGRNVTAADVARLGAEPGWRAVSGRREPRE